MTEDEISEAIRGLSLEELEAASSELTSEDLEGTDAKELGPDALGDPEAAAAANAGAEWIGEFDGRDDDFDASWRKEAEELIFAAASDVGVEIADVTWDLDKLKLTVAENLDAEDVSRATQAVIRALEVEDERLRILDRHELEVGTPGATDVLQKQRDFVTFKGFDVLVDTENPIEPGQKRTLQGSLVRLSITDLVSKRENVIQDTTFSSNLFARCRSNGIQKISSSTRRDAWSR